MVQSVATSALATSILTPGATANVAVGTATGSGSGMGAGWTLPTPLPNTQSEPAGEAGNADTGWNYLAVLILSRATIIMPRV